MKYQQPRFQLPATEGKGDCSQGHAMPDRKGKCIRCGIRCAEPMKWVGVATVSRIGCTSEYHVWDIDSRVCDCGKRTAPEHWTYATAANAR